MSVYCYLIRKSGTQFIEHLLCAKYYTRYAGHKFKRTQSLISWNFNLAEVKQIN